MDVLMLGLLVSAAAEAWLVWRLWLRALEAEDERDELRAVVLDRDELAQRRDGMALHSADMPAYR